ncbi:MAG: MFS transporter [Pirellulales bacterium]|nr:MFS transporter [Pirellulales bacterium]
MESPVLHNAAAAHASETAESRPLWNRSFVGLLGTQFFGAANDNMFRWLVVPIAKELAGPEDAALALSAGLACFVLPYLVLAAPAGYLADRFSKRNIIVACKWAEIVIMALGIATILSGNLYLMFIVVAMMGAQSALFSPSKLGSIPEIVHPRALSAANGWMGLTTVVAIIVGTAAGNLLYGLTRPAGVHQWWISGAALIGVAIVGLVASFQIRQLVAANPRRTFPLNFAWQVVRDQGLLASHRPLLLAALGTTFFWSLAALVQVNVDLFGTTALGVDQDWVGPLLGVLALGVGVGSVLAGTLSRGRVELRIVPFGALAVAAGAIFLFGSPGPANVSIHTAYGLGCFGLFFLGIGGGLFAVPLEAFLQDRSPDESRGVVLAAANFLTFAGMLAASGVFWAFRDVFDLSSRQIFLVCGIATLPVLLVCTVFLLPMAVLRLMARVISRLVYSVKITGLDNVPARGGALLVSNHITWIDGFLLLLTAPRPVRMVAHADYVVGGVRGWLARQAGIITLDDSRKSMVRAIREARDALANGELVCIFPEGGLSRTGSLREFRPGFLSILKGTNAPVIPVCLHGLWGSVFSFERGKFFWKWPRHWPYPVSILFGKPASGVATAYEARQMVAQLESQAMQADKALDMIPARYFLRNCRRHMRQGKLADSTGVRLTSADTLIRVLILRKLLRDILAADERQVGLLMPPTVAGAVANIAIPLAGRVPVNLNYSIRSPEVLNACLAQAGIRHVLTSRKVMEKLNLTLDAEIVYLEDLAGKIRWTDKLRAAAAAWCLPVRVLERVLGLHKIDPDNLATIIFTSGSTGMPKGVMLTHRNIASNVIAFTRFFRIDRDDILIGVLPFFHAFGYTVTLWAPLMLDPMGIYHHTPLEARQIGQLCKKHRATILVATPTFARSYLRRIEPEDFASLNLIVLGAEKMAIELADALENRFGVRPIEGYGATELSPVVCGNIPDSRLGHTDQVARKEGSAGKPLPGISAKIVDLETGEDLGPNRSGMLLVTGPNVMKGYLHLPEMTAEVIRDGWYVTGDVARIDEDGFIFITGRLSRFAKIGGEMVPHLGVEEAIVRALNLDEEEVRVVATSIPDERKGERLVVLHTGLAKKPDEVCRALAEAGLPPLWIPSPDSFRRVDEIPQLASGKLALKEVNDLARRLFDAKKEDGG